MGEMELDLRRSGHGAWWERSKWTWDLAVDVDSEGVGGRCYSRPDRSTKGLSRTQYRYQKNNKKKTPKTKLKTNRNLANL